MSRQAQSRLSKFCIDSAHDFYIICIICRRQRTFINRFQLAHHIAVLTHQIRMLCQHLCIRGRFVKALYERTVFITSLV